MSAHINLPVDIDENHRWTELGDDGLSLHVRSIAFCARNLTDGAISQTDLRRLAFRLTRRRAAQLVALLVETGFWREREGGWLVDNWESHALTADKVRALSAEQKQKAVAGGHARAVQARVNGGRDALGRMVPTQPAGLDSGQPAGLDSGQPVYQPMPSPSTVTVSTDVDTGVSGVAPPTLDDPSPVDIEATASTSGAAGPPTPPGISDEPSRMADHGLVRSRRKRYDPAWMPSSPPDHSAWGRPERAVFRRAWEARGFRRPPTKLQWALLEPVNRAQPDVLGRFVREAPAGLQSNEIVGNVLRRLNSDLQLGSLVGKLLPDAAVPAQGPSDVSEACDPVVDASTAGDSW